MHKQDLYLKNNPDILFAKEFTRVVHGGRGDYVEFTREQIFPRLFYKFPSEIVYDEFDINNFEKYTGFYTK